MCVAVQPWRSNWIVVWEEIGVVLFHAGGTNAVAEGRFGVTGDVRFHGLPIAFVVADGFAVGAGGEQTLKSADALTKFACKSADA